MAAIPFPAHLPIDSVLSGTQHLYEKGKHRLPDADRAPMQALFLASDVFSSQWLERDIKPDTPTWERLCVFSSMLAAILEELTCDDDLMQTRMYLANYDRKALQRILVEPRKNLSDAQRTELKSIKEGALSAWGVLAARYPPPTQEELNPADSTRRWPSALWRVVQSNVREQKEKLQL